MNDSDRQRMEAFISRWQKAGGNERANYQLFLTEFCEVLGVEKPRPKGTEEGDRFCFDKDIRVIPPDGEVIIKPNFIDLYKEGCFVLEAKQGSDLSAKGVGKRGTNSYRKAMKKAFAQALNYARFSPVKPPFLIVCDIGNHFRIWQDFNPYWLSANGNYGTYDSSEYIEFQDLLKPEIFERFVKIFSDPQSLNPEKIAAKVTREVAADLAKLAKMLEHEMPPAHKVGAKPRKRDPQEVAQFLMRCIFTMFAEDIELLPDHIFTNRLKDRWLDKPYKFKEEVEELWKVMNTGGNFAFDKFLCFNGNLFVEATAFNLQKEQLEILLSASGRDWKSVEPAIFGTLLEQALETDERSQLGAHYTPRSYVERLVRPTIIEPLQEQWQLIQGEVEHILDTESEATQEEKVGLAKAVLDNFLKQLREIKVLDPACGSGNFLYVTLDLMKTLELEVFKRLETVTGKSQLKLEFEKVNPSQFLGIEINPRAAAIADLVIWIGYLQWHFRLFGTLPPIEPVLREYKNIEFRDAVLAYDRVKTAVDPKTGKVRTRWGGKTIEHHVTGENVPDPKDQVKILHYVRPRPAQWPEADYIVSNPPFIGNKQMRDLLGDGYAEALRKVYKNVPETVDLVMYWWEKAANLLAQKKIKRFGFITTNSIKQAFNRPVLLHHLKESELSLYFAIPDHPWVNVKDGAAVRVALTVAISGTEQEGIFQEVTQEIPGDDGVAEVALITQTGKIYADLTIGSDVASMQPLKANENMSFQGIIPLGKGFRLTEEMLLSLGLNINNLPSVIRPYMIGRDLVQIPQKKWIIDFFQLGKDEVMQNYPSLFQIILDKVKPSRDYNRDKFFRENWWLFGRARSDLRNGIKGLSRFIVTPDTSKFKPFVFLDTSVLPDVQLYSIVSDDAWILAVLESKIHQTWLQEVAPRMGKGNDLRWKPSIVFHPFPFPAPSETLKQQIRDLGERLDNHRKTVQANHPDITLTGMYNLLEKMRKGEPFSEQDQAYNNRALVSILKQIHDELDTAVFAAYGWPQNLTEGEILESLVALNLERAEEEKNGLIRWLCPDYQAPNQITAQPEIEGIEIEETTPSMIVEPRTFPSTVKDQLSAIRELLRTYNREWTVNQIEEQFPGKKKSGAVANCLEILEELGLIISNEEGHKKSYYAAELQQN